VANIQAPISDDFWSQRLKFSDRQINTGQGDQTKTRQKIAAFVLNGPSKTVAEAVPVQERYKVSSVKIIDQPFYFWSPPPAQWFGKISTIRRKLPHFHPKLTSRQRSLAMGNLKHLNDEAIASLAENELRDPEALKIAAKILGWDNLKPNEIRERIVDFLSYQTLKGNAWADWEKVLSAVNRGIYYAMVAKLPIGETETKSKWCGVLKHIRIKDPLLLSIYPAISESEFKKGREEVLQALLEGRAEKAIIEGLQLNFSESAPEPAALLDLSALHAHFADAARGDVQTSLDSSAVQAAQGELCPIYDADFDEIRFVPRAVFNKFSAAALPGSENPAREMLDIVCRRLKRILGAPAAAAQELEDLPKVAGLLRNLYLLAQRKELPASEELLALVEALSKHGRSLPAVQNGVQAFRAVLADFEALFPSALSLKQESIHILRSAARIPPPKPPAARDKSEILAKFEEEALASKSLRQARDHLEHLLQMARTRKIPLDDYLLEDAIALSAKARALAEKLLQDCDQLSDGEIADAVLNLEMASDAVTALGKFYPDSLPFKEETLRLLQAAGPGAAHLMVSGRLQKQMLQYRNRVKSLKSKPILLHSLPTWSHRYHELLAEGVPDSDFQKIIQMRERELEEACIYALHHVDRELYTLSNTAPLPIPRAEATAADAPAANQEKLKAIVNDCLSFLRGSCQRFQKALDNFPSGLTQPLSRVNLGFISRTLEEIYALLTKDLGLPEYSSGEREFINAIRNETFEGLGKNFIRFQKEIEEGLHSLFLSGIVRHPGRGNTKQYEGYIAELSKHLGVPQSQCNLYQEVVQLLQGRLWMPLKELIKHTKDETACSALTEVMAMLKGVTKRADEAFIA